MPASTWADFRSAATTLGPTPGAREAWHRGRRRYAVWLLRVDDRAVRARLAEAEAHLRPHGVRAFVEPHVTVFVAGFPTAAPALDDDVDDAVLDAQAAALAAAPPPRPRLVVGGLNAFRSCPFVEVADPWGDLAALRATLAAAAREIRFARYVPHLTVGLFADERPTAPVADAIAPFRTAPPLALSPGTLDLVELDAHDPGAPLHTRVRVALRDNAPNRRVSGSRANEAP